MVLQWLQEVILMDHLSTRKREHGQEVHPCLMLFGTPKQGAWLSKGLRGKELLAEASTRGFHVYHQAHEHVRVTIVEIHVWSMCIGVYPHVSTKQYFLISLDSWETLLMVGSNGLTWWRLCQCHASTAAFQHSFKAEGREMRQSPWGHTCNFRSFFIFVSKCAINSTHTSSLLSFSSALTTKCIKCKETLFFCKDVVFLLLV